MSWLQVRSLAALVAALAVTGCIGPDQSGSVDAWLYLRDPVTNTYDLKVGQVRHLDSLQQLRGRDVVFRAGTRMTTTMAAEIELDDGSPFKLEYTIDADGVVVPGDLHSFHSLSLYRHLDSVASWLRDHGFVPSRPLQVYYLPRIDNPILGDSRLILTDNAAYMALGHAFLVVPTFMLADVPMLLNEGVVAHEYGHVVVHQEMFGEAPEAPHAMSDDPDWVVAGQHLAAMHEGAADIVAFAVVGDPNYIGPTIDIDRDVSKPRTLSTQELEGLDAEPDPDDPLGSLIGFDPHEPGSTLARTLYELWPKGADGVFDEAERSALLLAVLEALRTLDYQAGQFWLTTLPEAVIATLPAEDRTAACFTLRTRFSLMADRLTSCAGVGP